MMTDGREILQDSGSLRNSAIAMALLRRRSSLGTAHARLDQIILLERALREDAREVLRGVSSQHVLADLGSALESSGAHAHKDWYHLSRPCESLDCFVSHSWRQGRWMKNMARANHLHWKVALLLPALSIVATAAAFPFTYLPIQASNAQRAGHLPTYQNRWFGNCRPPIRQGGGTLRSM